MKLGHSTDVIEGQTPIILYPLPFLAYQSVLGLMEYAQPNLQCRTLPSLLFHRASTRSKGRGVHNRSSMMSHCTE